MERERPECGQQLLPGEERRRSQRVLIRIPVTLSYTAKERPVTIPAETIAVNDHGALIVCARLLPAGAKLELLNNRSGQRRNCRVTRASRQTSEGFEVPVEFDAPAKGFWPVSFPPAA